MPSVSDLEKQIFEKEGVRVIIRAPSSQDVPAYDFSRKLPDSSNIYDLRNRINKTLGDTTHETIIVLGDGNSTPHGLTGMEKARNSYK